MGYASAGKLISIRDRAITGGMDKLSIKSKHLWLLMLSLAMPALTALTGVGKSCQSDAEAKIVRSQVCYDQLAFVQGGRHNVVCLGHA